MRSVQSAAVVGNGVGLGVNVGAGVGLDVAVGMGVAVKGGGWVAGSGVAVRVIVGGAVGLATGWEETVAKATAVVTRGADDGVTAVAGAHAINPKRAKKKGNRLNMVRK